jgi:hypothetical protein
MISLKAFTPVLADILGSTPAAIYERQRALVRQGLLPAPVGRGPGNGIPATADTVAMILIALMVTDNLSDTDNRVKRVAEAKFYGKPTRRHFLKPRCALTGKRDFRSALIALLRMTEFPTRLSLTVSRSYFSSSIFWIRGEVTHRSEFGDWSGTASNLRVYASLGDGVLETISSALRSENIET